MTNNHPSNQQAASRVNHLIWGGFLIFVSLIISGIQAARANSNTLNQAKNSYLQDSNKTAEENIFAELSNPDSSLIKPHLLLILAATDIKNEQFGQAEVILTGLKNQSPGFKDNETLNILYARIQEKQGSIDQSLLELKKHQSDLAYFKTACLLELDGQSYAAILKFQELLDTYPKSSLVILSQLGLAASYITLKEWDHARIQLDSLEKLAGSQNFYRHYLNGLLAYQTNDFDKARQHFNAAASGQLAGITENAQFLLALTYLKSDQSDDGYRILTSIIEKGTDPLPYLSGSELMKYQLTSQNNGQAIQTANKLLGISLSKDERHTILLLRGIAYSKHEQPDHAVTDFQEVMDHGNINSRSKAALLLAYSYWRKEEWEALTNLFAPQLMKFKDQLNPKETQRCLLLIGEAYLENREYPSAEKIYSELLKENLAPAVSPKASSGYISALVAQQKFGNAEKELEELTIRFGEDRPVLEFGLLARAHLLWNKADYAQAAEAYVKYLELLPNGENAALATYMAGRSFEKSQQPDNAIAYWEKTRKDFYKSPYATRALVRLAAISQNNGYHQKAKYYYEEMAKGGNSQMMEIALLQLGLTRMANHEDRLALKTFYEFNMRHPDSIHQPKVREGVQKAIEKIARNQPEQLSQLISEYPNWAFLGEVYFWMAMQNFEEGKKEESIKGFQTVLNNYPTTPSFKNALFYKGQAELELKNYKGALVSLGKFIKENPEKDFTLIARYQRAGALDQAGYTDEAKQTYKTITEDSPYTSYAAESYLRWAQILESEEKFDDMLPVYKAYLKDFSKSNKANLVRWKTGHLYRRAGNYKEALNQFQNVVPEKGVATEKSINDAIDSLKKLVWGQ